LVLGAVEVGDVADLERGVGSRAGSCGRVRDGEAAVAGVDFGDGELEEGLEVELGAGVWRGAGGVRGWFGGREGGKRGREREWGEGKRGKKEKGERAVHEGDADDGAVAVILGCDGDLTAGCWVSGG
jgi:hypothetical protein